jgi:hypothetical protein
MEIRGISCDKIGKSITISAPICRLPGPEMANVATSAAILAIVAT